jgi:hypothetical protein
MVLGEDSGGQLVRYSARVPVARFGHRLTLSVFLIPVPGFASALSYYDALRTERLPAALIHGQRDFFGAHRTSHIRQWHRCTAAPLTSATRRWG